jgi:hypothetical protein
MVNEHKELICKECGCNVFMVRKSRDLDSCIQRTGWKQYVCIDCGDYDYQNTKWSDIESNWLEAESAKIARLELRIERLMAIKNRQQNWIDTVMMAKIESE